MSKFDMSKIDEIKDKATDAVVVAAFELKDLWAHNYLFRGIVIALAVLLLVALAV